MKITKEQVIQAQKCLADNGITSIRLYLTRRRARRPIRMVNIQTERSD